MTNPPLCPHCSAILRGWIAPPPKRMSPGEEMTLQIVLEHVGLPEIAAKVPHAKPGYIEALIATELDATPRTEERRRHQLECARLTARSIRKPINHFGEYMARADAALAT